MHKCGDCKHFKLVDGCAWGRCYCAVPAIHTQNRHGFSPLFQTQEWDCETFALPSSGPSVTMEWFNRFKDAVLYQEGTDEPKGIFLPVAKEMLRAIGVKVEEE